MKSIQEFKLNISESSNSKISEFVMNLFEARQKAHNFHLKSKSYSEHTALDSYYNGLLGLIDDFTETYQGQYGLLNLNSTISSNEENIISYLKEVAKSTVKVRNSIKDAHLQNIIDEITSLTYKTIYKLENLK